MSVSVAPGQSPTPQSMLPAAALTAASDTALAHTVAAVMAEQHRRAVADGDVESVTEDAFTTGFDMRGRPTVPWVTSGLLVCPGWVRYRSQTSHDCQFVAVGDTWVWDHPGVLADVMRQVPGGKVTKQSVTVLVAVEGLVLDQVLSASRQGAACQMVSATSFQVRAGELVRVATRARAKPGHTRM